MKNQLLSTLNQMCNCEMCGKRTHSSIEGNVDIRLCKECLYKAYKSNEHLNDEHNEGEGGFDADCEDCQKERKVA